MKDNMEIVFFSNFMNHHQLYVCEAMRNTPGISFIFVAFERVPEDRLALGYEDMNESCDCVLKAYESEGNRKAALELVQQCDVAIFGACPEMYVRQRMQYNKLAFRMNERPLKGGRLTLLKPKVLYGMFTTHTRYAFKPLYMLCASAYTALDCRLVGAYVAKAYRWGYFPVVKKYRDIYELIKKKTPASILWVGRLIEWKHPDASILLAKMLKEQGYQFKLTIIGRGEKEQELKRLIGKYHLEEEVQLIGALPQNEVRSYMEKAKIFLFTSTKEEGWGAVLNEAMNSACAVVAADEIGSVPFLINESNGFTYKSGNTDELFRKVKLCLDRDDVAEAVGIAAYRTMTDLWSPEIAAQRFIDLSKALLNKEKRRYKDGPCSRAKLL